MATASMIEIQILAYQQPRIVRVKRLNAVVPALYEPVHGSAPDIAGTGAANPIAMIASFAMALRYSFDMGALADKVDAAIAAVLAKGLRTADIKSDGSTVVSTAQMGEAILKEVQALHA
jgi:3-isopropylmalate dehydrogenase